MHEPLEEKKEAINEITAVSYISNSLATCMFHDLSPSTQGDGISIVIAFLPSLLLLKLVMPLCKPISLKPGHIAPPFAL